MVIVLCVWVGGVSDDIVLCVGEGSDGVMCGWCGWLELVANFVNR